MFAGKEKPRDDNRMTAITLALLGGAALGAAISLLLAPQSGAKTREFIADKAKELSDSAKDKLSWAKNRISSEADDMMSNARDMADNMGRKYNQVKNKMKEGARDITDEIRHT